MSEAATRLVELSIEECRQLLGADHLGRLAVIVNGKPDVFPVNYRFDGERIVIRTVPGTKLSAANLASVAFEIDGVDEGGRRGWSVVVHGLGYDATDALDPKSELVRSLPVDPWVPPGEVHWLRIEPRVITGRRLA